MKKLYSVPFGFLITVFLLTSAHALSFSFSDKDFLGGASWGTMEITVFDADELQVRYDAASSAVIPDDSEVTGFGFTFVPNTTLPGPIRNPLDGDFDGDRDDLNWLRLNNLNAIPQPANGDEFSPNITKDDYYFGVTEGDNNNFSPPGILPGEYDVFYLNFSGLDFNNINFNLNNFVALTGIRLQSLPQEINGGSLFLASGGVPIPEPVSMLLFGTGLVGIGGYIRKKVKKNDT